MLLTVTGVLSVAFIIRYWLRHQHGADDVYTMYPVPLSSHATY